MSSLPINRGSAAARVSEPPAKTPTAPKDVSATAHSRALLQRKLEEIVVLTRESTHADGVAIALREDKQFLCRASQGYAPEPGVVVEPGQGVCGRCIIDARVLLCQDLDGDVKSALAAPIIVGDEIEGLVAAFSFRPSAFDPAHVDLLSRIAVDIGEQVATPETIHLVPREEWLSNSALGKESADVYVEGDLNPLSRQNHFEVLNAVTSPSLGPTSSDALVDGAFPAFEQSSTFREVEADGLDPLNPTLHFFGYNDALPEAPRRSAASEMLGEYLSKWDVIVIFAAVLIAMLTFSLWLRHHRANAEPYRSTFVEEPASQPTPPPATASTPATTGNKAAAKSHKK